MNVQASSTSHLVDSIKKLRLAKWLNGLFLVYGSMTRAALDMSTERQTLPLVRSYRLANIPNFYQLSQLQAHINNIQTCTCTCHCPLPE